MAQPQDKTLRVVAHVDLDAFYCAVESQRNPALRGVPLGVSQYNPLERASGERSVGGVTTLLPTDDRTLEPDGRGGSLIAVSYEARAGGVKRGMRAQDAKAACPSLRIIQVPTLHGKADLTIYRAGGAAVLAVLARETGASAVERASIDEAYLDVTSAARALLSRVGRAEACRRAEGTHVGGVADTPEGRLSKATLRRGHAGGAQAGQGGAAAAAGACSEAVSHPLPNDAALSTELPPLADGDEPPALQHGSSWRELGAGEEHEDDVEEDAEVDDGTGGGNGDGGDGDAAATAAAASVAWLRRGEASWDEHEALLAAGAAVVAAARAAVATQLGYSCSAGVAANKLLAKLASGLKKPNAQTLLPPASAHALLRDLPLGRLRGLGGDLGKRVCETLKVATAGELAAVAERALQRAFGDERGAWISRLARGESADPVKPRGVADSVGCSKNFPGAARALRRRVLTLRVCHVHSFFWF